MENKHVGLMIIGLSVIIGIIVIIFNSALNEIVTANCSLIHGTDTCPMIDTIITQTGISLAIAGIVLIIGIALFFVKPKEKIIVKTLRERKKKLDLTGLDEQEKQVIGIIQSENGTIFQASLMEKLGIGKVGITRLLDKLEAKQFIERKRRGMNNVVVLKD